MTYQTIDQAAYADALGKLIKSSENEYLNKNEQGTPDDQSHDEGKAYKETISGKDRIAIGYGYDLKRHGTNQAAVDAVINDLNAVRSAEKKLTTDQEAAIKGWVTGNEYTFGGETKQATATNLEDDLAEFKLSRNEADTLFTNTVGYYDSNLSNVIQGRIDEQILQAITDGKTDDQLEWETVKDTWENDFSGTLPDSKAKAALVSLFYNSKWDTKTTNALIGKNLVKAVVNGDRVAAWLEIAFGSNNLSQGDTVVKGIQNRRLEEANAWLGDDLSSGEAHSFMT